MNNNDLDFSEIINHELFKDLKLSIKEVKDNFFMIKKIIDQDRECKQSNKNVCIFGGYHHKLIRNKYDKLEVITTNCTNHKSDYSFLVRSNYLYSDINISKNNQLLKKDNVLVKENDSDRAKFINFLLKMKKEKKSHSFYVYGDISTGKTYLSVALCNEFSLIGSKIVIINMNMLSSNISRIADDEGTIADFSEKLKIADILMIDELGNETINKSSHFTLLYPIILFRLENNLTTIFTSNFDLTKLLKNYLLDNYWKRNENQIKILVNRIEKIVGKNIYKLTNKYDL